MMITNMILSSLLTLQSFSLSEYYTSMDLTAYYPTVTIQTPYSKHNTIASANFSSLQESKMASYVQSVSLIYQDIYECTKPSLYKNVSLNGKMSYIGELNPIADVFFKNNLWDLAFVCANAFNYFMYGMDDFYYLYSAVLTIAEVWAISTWDMTSAKGINVKAAVFTYTF